MKKIKLFAGVILSMCISVGSYQAARAASTPVWKAIAPQGYTSIDWVGARGVQSFVKAPIGNGYSDYLTFIYLPYNEIKLFASTTPRVEFGTGTAPLNDTSIRNWAFTRMAVEQAKGANPNAKFVWNAPYFNVTLPVTDLSLGLKSEDASSTYITSGSRPAIDIAQPRKMLIIENKTNTAVVSDFNEVEFVRNGDQAVEGFDPLVVKSDGSTTPHVYLGTRANGKELVVYCSQSASAQEASDALTTAGVSLINQMQVDGGGSATCGYNLPGQYFVEPGRTLPHLMGAFSFLYKATVNTALLNVRSGPSTKNSTVRQLTRGALVTVYEEKNGWVRVSAHQEWVLGTLVKK